MKRPKLDVDHFFAQFHNHHHYAEYGPDERRPEWWELPEPRKRGGRVNFARGGFADGGDVAKLGEALHGAFSQLNQPRAQAAVATPAYSAPSYAQMLAQALPQGWQAPAALYQPPAPPTTAAPATAVETPAPKPYGADWSSISGMDANTTTGGGGGAFKRGGRTSNDIVERALTMVRSKR